MLQKEAMMNREHPVPEGEDRDQVDDGLGSPAFFATQLRMLRSKNKQSQTSWARAAQIDSSVLSRYEKGEQQTVPARGVLLYWSEVWGLSENDTDDLLIAAGHLPPLRALGTERSMDAVQLLRNGVRRAITEAAVALADSNGGRLAALSGVARMIGPIARENRALQKEN